ncbi:hypothetical protein GIB67_029729 [Kingdonia uniflora]|uniref:AP2/ERF domain-containing protein n=1 Tax=Kingdonia uniflora TaxID=39325 RepID=A0A7J7LLY9_9MAGN|nr:hypothetical protein GIB67_029729 [Kingdonia uniflora]
MAQSNWISFSQYPQYQQQQPQMFQYESSNNNNNTDSSTNQQYYLFNNLYNNNNEYYWATRHAQISYTEEQLKQMVEEVEPQQPNIIAAVPKLEDFLGGHSTTYADSQTNTQESSLSNNVYEQQSSFVGDQQDLKTITGSIGFQAFSTNSGSEVDDSVVSVEPTRFSLGQTSKAIVTDAPEPSSKKLTSDTFGQRTSIYRGVTRHRWTGRYEAHLWDNSCRREGQSRKGRQGGYDKEDKAARAYDLAALKYWGPAATTNFPVSTYSKEVEEMKNMTKQEFIASLRRKSSGFSRGASIYRGVTRHHQQGRWQARIGRVAGNKDLYLGTFGTEEEAAEAYDIAAIKFRGMNAVTNFEMNKYDVEAIANSSLPIGGAAKRLKLSLEAENVPLLELDQHSQISNCSSNIALSNTVSSSIPFDVDPALAFYNQQNLLHHFQSATGGSSDSSASSSAVTPISFMPPLEYCNRNFLYGLTNPIDIDSQQWIVEHPSSDQNL